MGTSAIPSRFPATENDLATSVMRVLGQHMEIGARLTFDGRLDPDVLRRAVRLSLDAEPILGCGLRTGFRSGWWERISDLDACLPFSLIETADPDADAPRFHAAPVPDFGPQVAVGLLRSRERDDVCVRISHTVADGQAAKQYLYLLADVYSQLVNDPAYLPQPNLAGRPSGQDMWRELPAEERSAAPKEPRPTMPNWDLPRKGVTGRGRTVRELRLEPDRFRAMREYGRGRGATVNEMLLTAFYRAMTGCFPPATSKPMSVAFSADHRRYLRDTTALPISNLAITIWLGVPYIPDEAFDGTLGRVMQQTGVWRDVLWGARGAVRALGLVKMGYKPARAMMSAMSRATGKSGKTSPIFTNIGVIDESRLVFADAAPIAARLGGPAAFGASYVPTVSTYRDTLWVSMGFCAEDTPAGDIEAVLGAMDAELCLASSPTQQRVVSAVW